MNDYKDLLIEVIRKHQYYEAGSLESMSFQEVRKIYESLMDWIA